MLLRTGLGSEPVDPHWVTVQKVIPESFAMHLATHPDLFIRCAYASRKDTPSKMLERFLYDTSSAVLASAAGNPNAPRSIREKAIAHADWAPRQQACANTSLEDDLLLAHYLHFGWLEYIVLVNKEHVPEQVLQHIAHLPPLKGSDDKDKNADIRERARKRLARKFVLDID